MCVCVCVVHVCMCVCTCILTIIRVHEMHGRMHPNYSHDQIFFLLVCIYIGA